MHFYVYFIEPDVNVDDLVLVEGDILLSKEQAAIYYESGWGGLVKSEAWIPNINRWNTRIPYTFDQSLDTNDQYTKDIAKNIILSIREITDRTCITMTENRECLNNKERNPHIKFIKGKKQVIIYFQNPY